MATITVTERAARHVSNYLQRQGHGIGVRLGIKTTGCSGFAYQLEYADEARAEGIDSSIGSATMAPNPRRNRRLAIDSGMLIMGGEFRLSLQEWVTQDNF